MLHLAVVTKENGGISHGYPLHARSESRCTIYQLDDVTGHNSLFMRFKILPFGITKLFKTFAKISFNAAPFSFFRVFIYYKIIIDEIFFFNF